MENEENDSSAFDELGRLGEELDFNLVEKDSISGKQGTKSGKKKSTEQRNRYATRGKKHSYCEAEVPDDDHYICKFIGVFVQKPGYSEDSAKAKNILSFFS